ncbi:MAG TPA: ABC transporter substrate-binding protein [Acidocella sp.]|jgi:branched-chain amino acid transport system substrate-binding protein|uniref:ABC transporter substrate-binding protein n=1 Tax=Acidocella sp. TaxID=50710 RepID=UPI002BCD9453|nr:ABC transporter substrate-binding protein [Acidocella sp.]HVE21287.1 ABC transporter substrate-binding protein [Acidocella sp.]
MTRPSLKAFVASLLCATALAATTHPAAADNGKAPITFLAAIIESGPFKVTDGQNLAGIEFAVDQINAKGGIDGHPVKLDVIDTELNAAVARRKTVDAVLQDHVSVIIGASGSDILRALVAVGQQYHVPVIAFAGEVDELTGAEFQPAVFRVASSATMHAAAIVYALKHDYPGVKKVFLLNEDYSFGHQSAVGFQKALARLDPGVQIVGDVFHPRGAADFSPYLQQIQASGADFVLTADWGADLVQLLNQANSFGLKPRIGGTFLADPDVLKHVGNAAIGDIGADVYEPTIDSPQNDAFVASWHAAHAQTDVPWPTASVGKSYIATQLAALAIQRAGSTDFDKVEKALEGLQYNSVAGPLTIRSCDHQVQIGQATGEVEPTTGKFYNFPFIGTALIAPIGAIAVPPAQTGNSRCTTGNG